jgi:hypothetical protein
MTDYLKLLEEIGPEYRQKNEQKINLFSHENYSYLYELMDSEYKRYQIWQGVHCLTTFPKIEKELIKNQREYISNSGFYINKGWIAKGFDFIIGIRVDHPENVKVSLRIGFKYVVRHVTIEQMNNFLENLGGIVLANLYYMSYSFEFNDSKLQKYYAIGYNCYSEEQENFRQLNDYFIYPITHGLRVFVHNNGLFGEDIQSTIRLRNFRNAVRVIERSVLQWLYRPHGSYYRKCKKHFKNIRDSIEQ